MSLSPNECFRFLSGEGAGLEVRALAEGVSGSWETGRHEFSGIVAARDEFKIHANAGNAVARGESSVVEFDFGHRRRTADYRDGK